MSEKTDFTKSLDSYRARPGQFRLVEVPPLHYLMLDGAGDPNTAQFGEAIESLYPLAYALKFASKLELGRDYVVPPLEALWWAEDMSVFTSDRDKSRWSWTLMLMTPEWILPQLLDSARAKVHAKGAPARLDEVRLAGLAEGTSAQTLHVGSFDDEGPVLARLHEEFLPANGLAPSGHHHEIYLSDFRKVAPEKFRTILRQPVTRAGR